MHRFWNTQPVPDIREQVETSEPIKPSVPPDQIKQEPYDLPEAFEWDTLELDDDNILKELYTLLNENYVEDEDRMFRFDYSPQFLRWALQPPGWKKNWHCGVRAQKSGKLVGFIGAVPAKIKVAACDSVRHVPMVEINFLCAHKKLRSKRMAPMLITEMTRRVNLEGIFQAIYTAGVVLPKPVAQCRYYHRPLHPKKLIEVKFSSLTKNMTIKRTMRLFNLPGETRLEGFKEFTVDHVQQVYEMLSVYLDKFNLAPKFDLMEVKHWFLPQEDVINSYVVERDGKVLAFTSFYTLPSTVISHPTHHSIKAAYSFYNCVTDSVTLVDLIRDALIVAKKLNYDVFNALDLMENKEFLDELKFGIGDGDLQYYLYNWKCPMFETEKVSNRLHDGLLSCRTHLHHVNKVVSPFNIFNSYRVGLLAGLELLRTSVTTNCPPMSPRLDWFYSNR